jgi:fatty-acyl-CoA synthase
MLSYAHGAYPEPLLGETIGHNLERTAARVPDTEALVSFHQGVRYTYAEFDEVVDRLASSLLAAGLRRQDRVGVWSPNRAEWALVQYATAKLGLILVNINPAYRLNELEYALGQSGCRWLFAAQSLKGSSFVEMVQTVRPQLPELERAVFFDTPEWEELGAAAALCSDVVAVARATATTLRQNAAGVRRFGALWLFSPPPPQPVPAANAHTPA